MPANLVDRAADSRSKAVTETIRSARRRDYFGRVATWATRAAGSRWVTLLAVLSIVVWAATGPFFHFSENWQLVINTGTTIVTFLMVFLIQNAQNRESKALHLKLDELLLAVRQADNELISIENLTEEHLEYIAKRYQTIAAPLHEELDAKIERVSENVEQVADRVAESVKEKVADHVEQRVADRLEEIGSRKCD